MAAKKDPSPLVSIAASVPGEIVTGRIETAGDRYEVWIDDRKLGAAPDLKACLRTVGLFLRVALPPVEEGEWELDVSCPQSQRFGISLGNMGPMTWVGSKENTCIENILNAMPLNTMSDAIEASMAAIATCCVAAGRLEGETEDLTDGGLTVGTKTRDP
ncbi:MAG TPA: hypothetical protein VNP73_01515 [Actinomycetota bacterium]|nr:hypothetical protein [Actinomycetota bacterium]